MKTALKNILMPTDFSDTGNNVLSIAIELCKQNNAVLHLLHVVESRYIITGTESGISLPAIANEIDADARARLYNIYQSVMRTSGIAVQIHMPTGIPYDEICKAADEMPIDLIVMGAHGASGSREFFMGTTAYSVIKNTTKPVLTIPSNYMQTTFSSILFPVRPVKEIRKKFEYIQSFLLNKNFTQVHVAVLCKNGQEEDLLANEEELHDIINSLEQNRITATKEIYRCRNFATRVLELAGRHAADLIVINSSLDYKWTQFFVGPFTQQVVNHSKVPVLSYRNGINVPLEMEKEKERELAKKRSVG